MNFVSGGAVDFGADGAGSVSYALSLTGSNVNSGLFALDNTDLSAGDGDGFGQGSQIVLNQSGNTITGSVGATNYFTLTIDPATGIVTFTQLNNIWHPTAGSSAAALDEAATLNTVAANLVRVVQTVTDADGDTDTASINIGQGVFIIQDDGPRFGPDIQTTLDIDNDATPSGTGQLDITIGTDSPNGGSGGQNPDDILVSNFVVSVNGIELDPADFSLTPVSENATTASYTFTFDYDTGSGGIETAEGTLEFNKALGTYTVALTNGPLQGFSILQTATGTGFTGYDLGTANETNSQPDVAVTQLRGDPSDPDPATDLFIQFTSIAEPSSGTGTDNLRTIDWDPDPDAPNPSPELPAPGAWTAGELFNQAPSWVSASNSDNGVSGDTIQGGEVLDFVLVKGDNPQGFIAQPEDFAQATTMFLKFDGISDDAEDGEDLIVILKLYDPIADTYTTRAVLVENEDVIKGPRDNDPLTPALPLPSPYQDIVLDNNDGFVVIEPNDYLETGENWVIVGAQIAGSDEGVTGTAIDLNGAIGVSGGSDGGDGDFDDAGETQNFSDDVNNGPLKISSIGFLSEDTNEQNATLEFDVTIHDADGDTATTSITVNIGEPVVTLAASDFSAMSASSATDGGDGFSNLSFTNDNMKLGNVNGNAFGNVGTTGIVAGMVAASGMAAMSSTSLHSFNEPSLNMMVQDSFQQFGAQVVGREGINDNGLASISFGNELSEPAIDAVSLSGSSFNDFGSGGHTLDVQSFGGAAPVVATNFGGGDIPAFSAQAFVATAPTVGMASAEALQLAGLAGNVQHGGSVEKILADALGHGAPPTVDGLLEAITGHGGGVIDAIANAASPAAPFVPAWDMGFHGAFVPGADMMFKMGAEMLHHDAVQPVVNG